MNNKLAFAYGVGVQGGGVRAVDPAFRCGIAFRGDGMPTRDAGSCAEFPARMAAGSPIEVSWGLDVSWGKRIRFLKH
jgi:hypothetical protein